MAQVKGYTRVKNGKKVIVKGHSRKGKTGAGTPLKATMSHRDAFGAQKDAAYLKDYAKLRELHNDPKVKKEDYEKQMKKMKKRYSHITDASGNKMY
jgi:hypothetical protein